MAQRPELVMDDLAEYAIGVSNRSLRGVCVDAIRIIGELSGLEDVARKYVEDLMALQNTGQFPQLSTPRPKGKGKGGKKGC